MAGSTNDRVQPLVLKPVAFQATLNEDSKISSKGKTRVNPLLFAHRKLGKEGGRFGGDPAENSLCCFEIVYFLVHFGKAKAVCLVC